MRPPAPGPRTYSAHRQEGRRDAPPLRARAPRWVHETQGLSPPIGKGTQHWSARRDVEALLQSPPCAIGHGMGIVYLEESKNDLVTTALRTPEPLTPTFAPAAAACRPPRASCPTGACRACSCCGSTRVRAGRESGPGAPVRAWRLPARARVRATGDARARRAGRPALRLPLSLGRGGDAGDPGVDAALHRRTRALAGDRAASRPATRSQRRALRGDGAPAPDPVPAHPARGATLPLRARRLSVGPLLPLLRAAPGRRPRTRT